MMAVQPQNIDYVRNNFIYPELTEIHEVPNYEGLQIIQNELKANAGTVQTHLGGGANGHLGLVMTDADYADVCNTPYVRPKHPGST